MLMRRRKPHVTSARLLRSLPHVILLPQTRLRVPLADANAKNTIPHRRATPYNDITLVSLSANRASKPHRDTIVITPISTRSFVPALPPKACAGYLSIPPEHADQLGSRLDRPGHLYRTHAQPPRTRLEWHGQTQASRMRGYRGRHASGQLIPWRL